jgi:hypothetical protein
MRYEGQRDSEGDALREGSALRKSDVLRNRKGKGSAKKRERESTR